MNGLDRTKKLIGKIGINKLKSTSILIVGIGGVGGICLEMLVRSGIKNITVMDFDVFEESNLNRQILCLKENLGKNKVDIAISRVKSINNDIIINKINSILDEKSINNIPITDYIIDACDDVKAKVLLVKFAIKNNIKIISSCGTGNRLKPEKLIISNIWETSYDPLARKFRNMLRKENINFKLPVVCSKEIPIIKTNNYVSSISLVPNCAGILLASYVINDILDK